MLGLSCHAMPHIVRAVILLVPLAIWPGQVAAQDLKTYLGGSFAVTPLGAGSISGGTPSTSFTNSVTDSLTLGVIGEAGASVSPHVSVGVELDVPLRRITVMQQHNYSSEIY